MATSPRYCTIATLCLFFTSSLLLSSSALDYITRDSSLAVEDHDTNFLVSDDGSFACGFYEVGDNAFAFAIWFQNSANRTTAWAANRDRPVNGRGSRISLRKDGRLALTDFDGTVVWSTNTSSSGGSSVVAGVKLFSTGNLAVVDTDGNHLWQSFDSPTDTLLMRQQITRYTPLVSSSSRGSISSGFYRFYFDNDNVLRLIYEGQEISSIYWPDPLKMPWQNKRATYDSSRLGSFDETGHFYATDNLQFNASDYGHGITRRLTLDYDGNLRYYSLNEQQGSWSVTWQALQRPCDIHGTCGLNALCVHGAKAKYCSCLPGFDVIDSSDLSKGCRPKYNFSCRPHQNHFLEIPFADFWGFDMNYSQSISFAGCRKMCSQTCGCRAFAYKEPLGSCYPKNILFNGRSTPDLNNTVYLKIARSVPLSQFSVAPSVQPLVCNDTEVRNIGDSLESYRATGGKMKWEYFYGFVLALFVMEALFIACGWWFIFRREQVLPLAAEDGYSVISSQFRRFTYAELKKATTNFKDVLGRGGSGVVYRGIFDGGDRVMAVKKLEDVIQGEVEFQAELSLIGRINHRNLVRMFGFCSEHRNRLLVSEFIENGSLDKYMFDGGSSAAALLGWRERFKIAVGVAKGLAYLHHECLEWIIHCDVKPENIFLDQGFEPKIADFGLAKLLNRGEGGSNLSRIRGTRGYIAPEWASSLPINGKVDVYSYGVVLLELVKGGRVSSWMADGAEEAALVLRKWIAVLKEKMERGEEGWTGEFVDHRLGGEVNWRQALLLLQVAVSCLEEDRKKRPSMDSIVQMLLSAADVDDDETSSFDDPGII